MKSREAREAAGLCRQAAMLLRKRAALIASQEKTAQEKRFVVNPRKLKESFNAC